ncbi:helix-turn-helix domain-containing protein [Streptomyces sp. G-G2]|uniref:GlxA family transcriptional regulator n=1 Tax=Streptomyces sp. G-G2 TaxID=3046201 RepID=UPI0024BB92FF|nr:helix-turn-helix domain-containing protein [Streptomyces sp. G-G2]MDJ0386382.1 helix-turn-helix domain-containing protein [Streptomyces sp. G-G2]
MDASLRDPHLVVIAVFPGIDALDVTGPAEAFAIANQMLRLRGRRTDYEVRLIGERRGPVPTFSGIQLYVEHEFAEHREPIGTLVVPGRVDIGAVSAVPQVDPAVVTWLREVGPAAGRVASVCAGAHITAAAGLLDGHRATTHWATAGRLASEHPAIEVDADPIFVRSGRMWTSAGITASIDLAVALVAEDHGDQVALDVARAMVMYMQRPGGQSQFSVPLAQLPSTREDVHSLRRWIGEHLDDDLSVQALAGRMAMSERHFARVFLAETGSTPGAFVEQMRLEAARRLLERTDRLTTDIARTCGFGSVETFYRVVRDRLGTTPGEYRNRFRISATA